MLVDVVVSTRNNYSEKNFSLYYAVRSASSIGHRDSGMVAVVGG